MTAAAPRRPRPDRGRDTAPTAPPSMAPVVTAIVGTALAVSASRADQGDLVHGVVAALRHLRNAVDEQAGYAMAASTDGAIRALILADCLSAFRRDGAPPSAVALPAPGTAAPAVATILENAAASCLAVNAHAPDNGPLEHAVFILTGHLLRLLGGPPDWAELRRALHRPNPVPTVAALPALPAGGGTIH